MKLPRKNNFLSLKILANPRRPKPYEHFISNKCFTWI